jgi:hypothetical protein
MVELIYNVTSQFVRAVLEKLLAAVTLKCVTDITMRRKKDVLYFSLSRGAGWWWKKFFLL